MAIPTYVPLIISLFALVLPFLNTLKVFFDTAEGYKKCSEAIIGPWSSLRWRKWSWSEFRFEAHFVTPKIVLHNVSDERVKQASYQARYLALRNRRPDHPDGGKGHGGGKREVGYWGYLPHHWRSSSTKRTDALLQSGAILDASLRLAPDSDTRSAKTSSTPGVASDEENQSGELPPDTGLQFASEQSVSWLTFLRHLYKIESLTSTARKSRLSSGDRTARDYYFILEKLEVDSDYKHQYLPASNFDTGISISFIEWTWDSLPAKATRPMASTSLGTLVVMATRLGMKWRVDLEKDSYQAVGNGYTLSCTQVPEMGLVASFTADDAEERDFGRSLVFNRSTDTMMCGIIPGAHRLVDVDFYCTDDAGTTDILKGVSDVVDGFDRLRRKLEPDLILDDDHARGFKMLADEMMALLCELPLKLEDGQGVHTYNFPSGIFLSPATSDAWLDALVENVGKYERAFPAFDELRKLRWNSHWRNGNEVSFCRRLYHRTTSWFISRGFGVRSRGHTLYVHLVVAHCFMSHEAWKDTLRRLKDPPPHHENHENEDHSQEENDGREEDGEDDGGGRRHEKVIRHKIRIHHQDFVWSEKDPVVHTQLRALALLYWVNVSCSRDALARCNRELPDDMASRECWTVLMLRGIAWSTLTRRKSSASGQAIPSSCWDNQRPVWMI